MVFLLDGSRGVTRDNLTRQKQFIKKLANHFGLNPYGPRGSAVIYAQNPSTIATFTSTDISRRVDGASLLRTPRRMDRALEHAAKMLSRTGKLARKIVVLLTSGIQAEGAKPLKEAIKPLQGIGAQTFVVAVGRRIDSRELRPVVDRNRDIFKVLSHSNLPSQSQLIATKIRSKTGK